MLTSFTLANSIIAFGVTVTAYALPTAPALPTRDVAEGETPVIQRVASKRPGVRRLTTTASPSGEKCGVWRCTWPTSNGGCLVWEKTKCKTIDPFN